MTSVFASLSWLGSSYIAPIAFFDRPSTLDHDDDDVDG
jgi:hypothetical protein